MPTLHEAIQDARAAGFTHISRHSDLSVFELNHLHEVARKNRCSDHGWHFSTCCVFYHGSRGRKYIVLCCTDSEVTR